MVLADYSLNSPWLGLAGGVAAVCLLALLHVRFGPPVLPAMRRLAAFAGQALVVLAAVLAFGDLRESSVAEARAVLLLVDASASADANSVNAANRAWRRLKETLGEKDVLAAAAYGDGLVVLSPFAHPGEQPGGLPWTGVRDSFRLESRLAPALRMSQVLFPQGFLRQVILVSDGGGAEGVSSLPAATAILSVPEVLAEDAALASIALTGASGSTGSGGTVEVTVHSSVHADAEVSVSSGAWEEKSVHSLHPGLTPVAVTVPSIPDPGTVVSARISAQGDSLAGNEELKLAVPRLGRPPVVALVDGSTGFSASSALAAALQHGGVSAVQIHPEHLSADPASLDRYDAIVIADAKASQFPVDVQNALEAWTLAGGGIAMLGSPNSFAPGGWHETPVERVLPVSSRVERDPSNTVAICIAMDISGSMAAPTSRNRTKMDEANRGAELSMRMAMDGDEFGVLVTNTGNRWVTRIAPLEDRAAVQAKIRSIVSEGGGINARTSVEEALRRLSATSAKRKFLILFADADDVDEQDGVPELVTKARAESNVEVSTIAIGKGAHTLFLRQVADAGGGQMLETNNAELLPVLFSSEVARFAGGHLDERVMGVQSMQSGFMLDDIGFDSAPALKGMVLTTRKANAVEWLRTSGGDRPLLATWRTGLGRGMVFTSDARDRWADSWLGWDGYAKAWQRWIRWLASGGGYSGAADADVNFSGGSLSVDLIHRPQDDGVIVCQVWMPDAVIRRTKMDRLSATRAVASLPARPPGAYRLDFWFEPANAGDPVPLGTVAAARPQLEESTPGRVDPTRLGLLAAASKGGRVSNVDEALAFDPPPVESGIPAPVPIGLAALGGLLLLAGARRFPKLFGRDDQSDGEGVNEVLAAWGRQRRLMDKRKGGGGKSARDRAGSSVDVLDGTGETTSSLAAPSPIRETPDGVTAAGLSSLAEAKRLRDRGRQ